MPRITDVIENRKLKIVNDMSEIEKIKETTQKKLEEYKKIIENSAFCSEDNNIISENYKITKDQKIGIIPPIGGG